MKKVINKLFDTYAYIRICWSDAYGHFDMPVKILDRIMWASIFLKVYGIENFLAVGAVVLFIVVSMITVGHFSLKKGLTSRIIGMQNKYNPDLQAIVRATVDKKD